MRSILVAIANLWLIGTTAKPANGRFRLPRRGTKAGWQKIGEEGEGFAAGKKFPSCRALKSPPRKDLCEEAAALRLARTKNRENFTYFNTKPLLHAPYCL